MRKKNKYQDKFLKEADIPARMGKIVYIRKEHQKKSIEVSLDTYEVLTSKMSEAGAIGIDEFIALLLTKESKEEQIDYQSAFIQESCMTARSGKLVYVRKDYHERILRIIRVIAKDRLSLFGYIDHVLTRHFAEYEDEIKDLYKKSYEEVF